MTQIDGLDIHFIHVKSKHQNELPMIVTHGWPGSVIEQLKIIEPLRDVKRLLVPGGIRRAAGLAECGERRRAFPTELRARGIHMLALRALHAEPPGASGERLGRWHEGSLGTPASSRAPATCPSGVVSSGRVPAGYVIDAPRRPASWHLAFFPKWTR
jgi:Epoxide hydrolase N terminus